MAASNAKDGKPYRHDYHFAGFAGGSGILGGQVWHGLERLRFRGPRALNFGVRVEP